MDKEKIFKKVLDCSFQIHSALGPGLLESAYQECLYYELVKAGLKVEKNCQSALWDYWQISM
jgi:GxxExxY protein